MGVRGKAHAEARYTIQTHFLSTECMFFPESANGYPTHTRTPKKSRISVHVNTKTHRDALVRGSPVPRDYATVLNCAQIFEKPIWSASATHRSRASKKHCTSLEMMLRIVYRCTHLWSVNASVLVSWASCKVRHDVLSICCLFIISNSIPGAKRR